MSASALALILAAAVCHALWNLLAKGARNTVAFTWDFAAASVVLYAPLAAGVWVLGRPALDARALVFVVGSGLLHLGYYLLLGQGYRVGDLSLVYPLARGTGPLLATLAAIALLGERPSPLALAGAALVVGGVFLIALPLRQRPRPPNPRAVAFALATGAFIATYTLWDKQGVALVPPLLYNYGVDLVRMTLLAPVALRTPDRRKAALVEWRARPGAVLGVALLGPAAYILVLTALAASPVSYVAPAREVSIVIGAALGIRYLGETEARRRLLGAAAIVMGVVGLAVG